MRVLLRHALGAVQRKPAEREEAQRHSADMDFSVPCGCCCATSLARFSASLRRINA